MYGAGLALSAALRPEATQRDTGGQDLPNQGQSVRIDYRPCNDPPPSTWACVVTPPRCVLLVTLPLDQGVRMFDEVIAMTTIHLCQDTTQ